MRTKLVVRGALIGLLIAGIFVVRADAVMAQQGQAPAPAPAQAAPPLLSKAQLDQLVAPIALYPDPLLSQIMMGSTYAVELVEASRWADAHKGVSGAALTEALKAEPWDESVKALVATPSVLDMMSQKLEWTQDLGNAVVAQQAELMAAVQRLRLQAQNHGALKTTAQQTVSVDSSQAAPVIEIMPAQPDVIYVPYYEPAAVYGVWAYPAYPPYFFPAPVGWVAGPGLWWGSGVALGFGWDHWGNWGRFNWHGGNIYMHGNVNAHWQVDNNHVGVNNHPNVNVNVHNNNVNVNRDNDHNNDNNGHANDDGNRQDDHASDNYGRDDAGVDRGVDGVDRSDAGLDRGADGVDGDAGLDRGDGGFDRGDEGFDRGDEGFDRGDGGFDRGGGFGGGHGGGGGGRR